MSLNKYNQLFGTYIDTDIMTSGDVSASQGYEPPDAEEYLDMVQDLEEKYADQLKETVEKMLDDTQGNEDEEDPIYGETVKQKIKDALMHETVNLYAESGIFLPYPEATWWRRETETGILSSGITFSDIQNNTGIAPVIINRSQKCIFEARYEFPQYNKPFKHTEAVFYTEDVVGWIDFRGGVPYGCLEKMGIFGEVFSKDKSIGVTGGDAVAPLPTTFFSKPSGVVLLFNKIWLGGINVLPFTTGLSGYPVPDHNWWIRFNLVETEDNSNVGPTPGEFMGIVIWVFPNLPWGWQETSPFIYSGNWMETVYYTTAKVTEVVDETTYKVLYHDKEVEARSSDYAIYNVDDRVAILKGVEHPEDSMTWDDMTDYDAATWSIIPVIFYYSEVI